MLLAKQRKKAIKKSRDEYCGRMAEGLGNFSKRNTRLKGKRLWKKWLFFPLLYCCFFFHVKKKEFNGHTWETVTGWYLLDTE